MVRKHGWTESWRDCQNDRREVKLIMKIFTYCITSCFNFHCYTKCLWNSHTALHREHVIFFIFPFSQRSTCQELMTTMMVMMIQWTVEGHFRKVPAGKGSWTSDVKLNHHSLSQQKAASRLLTAVLKLQTHCNLLSFMQKSDTTEISGKTCHLI